MNYPLKNPRYMSNQQFLMFSNHEVSSPSGVSEFESSMSPVNFGSPEKLKKKVSFSNMAEVILIPSRVEYFSAGLAHSIWSSKKELREYKRNAREEYLSLVRENQEFLSNEGAQRNIPVQSDEQQTSNFKPL